MAWEAQEDAFIAKLLVSSGSEVSVGSPVLLTVEDVKDVDAFTNFVVSPSIDIPAQVVNAPPAPAEIVSAPAPVPPVVIQSPAPVVSVAPPKSISKDKPVIKKESPTFIWGAGVVATPLSSKLGKEQSSYNLKFGVSLHKPLSNMS